MKSNHPIFSASTPEEVDAFEALHQSWKQEHYEFYYNNSGYRGQQQYKFQRRLFIDKLRVNERNHVSDKHPVLFVGDRGYFVNSPTKSIYVAEALVRLKSMPDTALFC